MKSFRSIPLFKLALLLLAGFSPAAVGFSAVAEFGQQTKQGGVSSEQVGRSGTAATPDPLQRPILTAQADQILTTQYRETAEPSRPETIARSRSDTDNAQARSASVATQGSNEPGIWSAVASTLALALFFLFRRAG